MTAPDNHDALDSHHHNARGVIFDLDGTLADTLPDIRSAVNAGRSHFGLAAATEDEVRSWIGEGLPVLCERALHDAKDIPLDTMIEVVRDHYRAHSLEATTLFPGIAPLLDALVARRIPMAICTNKPHEATLALVKSMLNRWEFAAVEGYREEDRRKPDPRTAVDIAVAMSLDPGEFCFVGDSDTDMLTATNAGMIPVGVSWGYRSEEVLRNAGASQVLIQPMDLIEYLE